MVNFKVKKNDNSDFILALAKISSFCPEDMSVVINSWTDCLLAPQKIFKNKLFEKRDLWFGFGCEINKDEFIDECEFFKCLEVNSKNKNAVINFVKALITFNNTYTDEGLNTNEEIETGLWAFEWILKSQVPESSFLYMQYLQSIDLNHTVEQPNMIEGIWKLISPDERAVLLSFFKNFGGQIFDDYIRAGRIK